MFGGVFEGTKDQRKMFNSPLRRARKNTKAFRSRLRRANANAKSFHSHLQCARRISMRPCSKLSMRPCGKLPCLRHARRQTFHAPLRRARKNTKSSRKCKHARRRKSQTPNFPFPPATRKEKHQDLPFATAARKAERQTQKYKRCEA